jgi:hypothetical protein
LAGSVFKLTQLLLHVSGYALSHLKPHTVLLQTAVPCAVGGMHWTPHILQLSGSLFRSTQLMLHKSGDGAAHCDLHWKLLVPPSPTCAQSGVAVGHAVHEPQWSGLLMSTSHPSSALVEQCPKPVAHEVGGTTHAPAWHVVGPETCGRAVQSCVQEPQVLGSVSETHFPPQLTWGDVQVGPPSAGGGGVVESMLPSMPVGGVVRSCETSGIGEAPSGIGVDPSGVGFDPPPPAVPPPPESGEPDPPSGALPPAPPRPSADDELSLEVPASLPPLPPPLVSGERASRFGAPSSASLGSAR